MIVNSRSATSISTHYSVRPCTKFVRLCLTPCILLRRARRAGGTSWKSSAISLLEHVFDLPLADIARQNRPASSMGNCEQLCGHLDITHHSPLVLLTNAQTINPPLVLNRAIWSLRLLPLHDVLSHARHHVWCDIAETMKDFVRRDLVRPSFDGALRAGALRAGVLVFGREGILTYVSRPIFVDPSSSTHLRRSILYHVVLWMANRAEWCCVRVPLSLFVLIWPLVSWQALVGCMSSLT